MTLQPVNDLPAVKKTSPYVQALILVFLFVFTLLFYTFTHESGHAIVGLLSGGKITSFNVSFWDLSAHVGIQGELSDLQRLVMGAAGISLPVLVWVVFILLVPRIGNPVLEWLKALLTLIVLGSLLAWIVIPFLYMAGQTPADDSTSFLSLSGSPPLLVSGAALLVFCGGWALFLGRAGGARGLIARLRGPAVDPLGDASRQTLLRLVAVGGILAAVPGGVSVFAGGSAHLSAPEGYTSAAKIDFTQSGFSDASIYRFHLDQPVSASVFFHLKNINGTPVEISLTGPGGYHNTFLNFGPDVKNNQIGEASVHPKDLSLEQGDYDIRITFPQTPGTLEAFIQLDPAPGR